MIFERILKGFEEHKIRYAVIGGIAVNLHGFNRLTGDLDILATLDDENIKKFISLSRELGLVPRLPVKLEDFGDADLRKVWIDEKNMKVFSVYNPEDPLEHIDVKIDKPEQIEGYIKRAVIMDAGEFKISVVSINDLIALKREAGRERDLVDIRALERIKTLDE